MNLKGLCIGNYAYDKKLNGIIHFRSFHGLCNVEANPDDFEPIPLTEQWLLDFNCTIFYDGNNEKWAKYAKDGILIFIRIEDNMLHIEEEEICYCLHVHRFQNIIYYLTGKELIIGK